MKVSRVSGQGTHFMCSELSVASSDNLFQPGDYVACLYDGLWWIGVIRSVSD